MTGRLHALLDESGDQRKINRAEFPIRTIEHSLITKRTTLFLDRPTTGEVYPLRPGQLVSFDDWLVTVAISNVGEGYVEIADEAFAQVAWWSWPRSKECPTVMVRLSGLKIK